MSEYFLEGCSEFGGGGGGADDLFAIFESLDRAAANNNTHTTAAKGGEEEQQSKSKKRKIHAAAAGSGGCDDDVEGGGDRMSHITVERNRRKQMNEHLAVLRSLMPSFYVKRGDQASIIGGVVDYINELQQILQSLEAKRQRKLYTTDVLSPRLASAMANSPRPSQLLSPRKPPLSPRPPPAIINLPPISPRTPQTPQSIGPYIPTNTITTSFLPSPTGSSNSNAMMLNNDIGVISCHNNNNNNDIVANCKSSIADVEVKFSGPNLVLKTISPKIPGQAVKIIAALENLSLEILHVNVETVEDSLLVNSFTIKIGIECQLSAEELAQQVQQTFC
ncbi:Transcription factor SPEECHLESS [Linum grandiflorum]